MQAPARSRPLLPWSRWAVVDDSLSTAAWTVAFVGTILWSIAFILVRQTGLGDELTHFEYLQRLARGEWGRVGYLAMWPTYHWIAYGLTLGHPTLVGVRLVSTVCSVAGLICFGAAWERYHHRPPGLAVLLLATLPLLQPFTAMVYTDPMALAVLIATWTAQLHRRFLLAALLAFLACALRQSSVVWIAFIAAWELARGYEETRSVLGAVRQRLAAVWPLCAVIILFGLALVWAGGVVAAPIPENQPRPNIANVHFGAWLWFVFMMPLWTAQIPKLWSLIRNSVTTRPARAGLSLALLAAAVVTLTLTYSNPHPWNRPTDYWRPMNLWFLRNWPLVWFEENPAWRWLTATIVVTSAASFVAFLRERYQRVDALCVVLFGAVFLAPHFLVDPRYFIPLATFLLFFARAPERLALRLAVWWALLDVIHAPFILAGRSIW